MNNEKTSNKSSFAGLLRNALAISCIFLAVAAGCTGDKPAAGNGAVAFRNEMQQKLTVYSIGLAEPTAKKNRVKIKAALEKIHSVSTPRGIDANISLAVLDNHGVTVATSARSKLSGTQNYGKYHIVSTVLQKRKPFQSALYLQGGRKLYIICSPLIKGEKVFGILLIGIEPETIKQAGVSEKEFMSLDFNARDGGLR